MKNLFKMTNLLLLLSFIILGNLNAQVDLDTVKAKKFDTGKMWTFDFPPVDYLDETYGFKPTEEWLEDVRLSALRYGGGCTASFVSADGLIMTNNHCARRVKTTLAEEGEDLMGNGFYAATLEEERKIPGLFVDQLVLIEDVTEKIHNAINEGETDTEKIENKKKVIDDLITEYTEETGLKCNVVTLFNGGKYSLYGVKRYEDIRLVFIPEESIGYFGGDFDNFTFPRYNLDCAFVRAYDEDGKPLKTENFFKFSTKDISEDDVIFTVGNPGRTSRLKTVAQLEYNRDVSYRNSATRLNSYFNKLESLKSVYPEKADEFEKIKIRIGNGQKVYDNIYKGLIDPYLIARKRDFENKLKAEVKANPELNEKYGHVWDAIEKTRTELKDYDQKISAYSLSRFYSPAYFNIAKDIIEYVESDNYNQDSVNVFVDGLFAKEIDVPLDGLKLELTIDNVIMNLGSENELVEKLFAGKSGKEAVDYMLSSSIITDKNALAVLVKKGKEEVFNSTDPFIYFIVNTKDELKKLTELSEEVNDTEDIYEDLLGRALYEVHGTTIPPDANFTLRLSDGTLKSFDYNGTRAQLKTTFYGLYNRYYGNDKVYPFELHERWLTNENELDKSVPFNFISTNDIVGGNSGSAIINKDAEVVGLAFDGNIKSIVGHFIYMPYNNRCVAVSALGMLEAFKSIYKADRLYNELVDGKLK
ncbi:MAG: S46 family peptidase [Melioribacteraceae bacterium]|nr:S46 family peptidase [Melioribacteraceae bacterium]